jgi:N-acyl-D-amino-acid deacylase
VDERFDLVIEGGTVVDGSGARAVRADVGVRSDRVTAIGDLGTAAAAERIDAGGLTVCPGFVDLHSHSDLTLLSDGRARSKVRQGVTTEVVGNCGMSAAPAPADRAAEVRGAVALIDLDPGVDATWTDMAGYRDAVRRRGTAVNVAPLAGHVSLRVAVNGQAAGSLDAAGLARLEGAADQALADGAVGLSTGLMYPPARFADETELLVLGRAAARADAMLAVHMRDYGAGLVAAVDEAIAIADRTGCRLQISHLAVAGRRNWGSVAYALARVDAATARELDVAADIYPYLAGSANLSQLLPGWAQEGGADAIVERLADPATRDRIRAEWREHLHLGWDEVRVSLIDEAVAPGVLGLTVEEAGAAMGLAADEAALELIARSGDRVQMVAFGRSRDDLLAVLRHPATAIGSDGLALDPDGPTGAGHAHPRSYGCYPRLLGRLVREEGVLPLERAVAMSTSIPAARARLEGRGTIAPGAFADLVVLDAERVIDEATFEAPTRFPEGIHHVVVNGRLVVRDRVQDDDARPGRVLSRARRDR